MNKRNGIYLILGIVVLISIGFLVYYFNNLSDGVKYINTINQDDDNLVDTNEDYENDDDVNNNSENIDLDSNDNNTIIDESNQDNNENHIGEYDSANDKDNSSMNNESNYFNELSVSYFIRLIDNKEDFILVISQTWCGHCTSYKPKVEEVANNNKIVVYYIEYNMLSEDDKNIFNDYVGFTGTPTTVFFKDGVEIVDIRIEGDTEKSEIINIFRNNGYIR